MHPLAAWFLAVFIALEPSAPWRATYADTADVLADVVVGTPLFAGPSRLGRTAALYTSLAWFESHFRPDAEGDCTEKLPDGKVVARASISGRCPPGSTPHSFCLFQIGESNFAGLGITREQIQSSTRVCADAARRMIQASFTACRGLPETDMLGEYASGNGKCGGLMESRHRVQKAKWIANKFPFAE